MKQRQRRCLILTMMIAALSMLLAMPALAGNSVDEAKMYADQAAASTAKADMAARRNVEMAAVDAKASADKAVAAADWVLMGKADNQAVIQASMKKTAEVPSAVVKKIDMTAMVPAALLDKATKAQQAVKNPSYTANAGYAALQPDQQGSAACALISTA